MKLEIRFNGEPLGKAIKKVPFKWLFILVVLIGLSYTLFAAPITKPFTFNTGEPARASEMNDNFDTLYTKVNELDSRISSLE